MYCNIPVYVSYDGTKVLLVVTEIEYVPEQRNGEFLRESVGIVAGYTVCEDGEYTFDEVLEVNAAEVINTCLRWYKEPK